MGHRHYPITSRTTMRAWQYPVLREDHPRRDGRADGNVVYTEHCRCGASRRRAVNCAAEERGDWGGGEYAEEE